MKKLTKKPWDIKVFTATAKASESRKKPIKKQQATQLPKK